jgi:hypothetical protein
MFFYSKKEVSAEGKSDEALVRDVNVEDFVLVSGGVSSHEPIMDQL